MLDQLTEREQTILERMSSGLSDQQIADELFLSLHTVKWYNRQIYSKLGVSSRTQAIASARNLHLSRHDDLPLPPVSRHNLPAPTTPFIGRAQELADIRQLLDSVRLLTLTGTGGTGKTRLALRVASDVQKDFTDGVYFVDLAPLFAPTLVPNAIATVLDVAQSVSQPLLESLKHRLRHRKLLLVLDNFEHLLPGAPLVSELLAAAPDLKVLVTSREPLHLYGEHEYIVPPLELPDPEMMDLHRLAACESTALFMQQARAVRADFELTADNALDIAQICVRLDGLPLAIELAAARIKFLTPRLLLTRLSSRLNTLTGGAQDLPARQQTLRSTIEWSYNLLDAGEKQLFVCLAVFQGGCSLEAIAAVCGDRLPLDVFDGLESLVNKNLVRQVESPGGEPRFMMLETLHEYAWECIRAGNEAETLRRRHAAFFVELAERAEPELRRSHQMEWFRLLEIEHENLRTALRWSLDEGDKTFGARIAGALCLFWYAYGYHLEGRHWIQQLLEHLDAVDSRYRAKLLFAAGHIIVLYDLEGAKSYFARSLHLARESGDPVATAWALILLGYSMMFDVEAALATTEEGLALFRDLDHRPGIAQALNIVGEITRATGDDERARRAYEECLVIAQETGEKRRIRFLLDNLSFLAQHAGDYSYAQELNDQSLRIALEMNNRLDIADVLAGRAGILGLTGHPEQAARLFGVWQATLESLGAVFQPSNKAEYDRAIAAVRAQLDNATFEAAWLTGRAMSLEEAVALTLEQGFGSAI